jgi:hypothetical protein
MSHGSRPCGHVTWEFTKWTRHEGVALDNDDELFEWVVASKRDEDVHTGCSNV